MTDHQVTELLRQWSNGDQQTLERTVREVKPDRVVIEVLDCRLGLLSVLCYGSATPGGDAGSAQPPTAL